MLRPTHQFNGPHAQDVCAWQYLKKAPIPVWVCRNFHQIGDGGLTHRSGAVLKETEWVCYDLEKRVMVILNDAEFQLCFKEIPRKEQPDGQGS